MKKGCVVIVSLILGLFFINFVFAESISEDLHLNIQTTYTNGTISPGTFAFVFNISKNTACSDIVYTNSTTLTTDTRGIISYYLTNVSLNYSEQYYLCYYRNGTLKDSAKIARTPYSFRARNITLSGVEPDSNFSIGVYNMTASYYFGNGTYLVDVNDTLSQLNCANEQVVKWNATSNLWYCSDVSAPGVGDIDAVNTDNIYLTGGQTSGTANLAFNETLLNQTIDQKISTYNASIFSWVVSYVGNLLDSVGNWTLDKPNYYNIIQINAINDSMNNTVNVINTTLSNYINLTNTSMRNYVDSTFLTSIDESNLSVNNTANLGGYPSTFFMPLNTSVYGNFDFNGGWLNNGLSIVNGNIYAQTGYFYNISSLSVQNLNINGSLLPYEGVDFDGIFDIGSPSSRWKDLYLSGQINAGTANITDTLYVGNVDVMNYIDLQNTSQTNYIDLTNASMKNYTDFVGSRWNANYTAMQNPCTPNFVVGLNENGSFICGTVEAAMESDPYWYANWTAFNASWSNTTNASYMTGDNFTLQNISMNNYINLTNQSVVNWVNSTFVNQNSVINLNVNNSQYLGGYNSSFFMPLNTSVYGDFNFTGQVDFNGGWLYNGVSIINGNIWAQNGYFSNLTTSGQIKAETANITDTLYVGDVDVMNYIDLQNTSQTNYIDLTNASMKNYTDLVGSRWNANYTAMQNPCTPDFVVGIYENGTFMCGTFAEADESDPYWTANWTAFNASWSNTTNDSYMTGDNFTLQNISMNNYINLTNQSVVNWVNSTFVNQSSIINLNVNNSQYLDGYDSSFFMPLNTSVYGDFNFTGQVDFNGGWLYNGVSIINGNIWAQNGYFSNLTTSGQIKAETANITDTLYVGDVDVMNYIDLQNTSQTNYINATNLFMKNYTDLVGSRWNANYTAMQNSCTPDFVVGIYENGTFKCGTVEAAIESDPYWTGNYTMWNATWSNTTNASYMTGDNFTLQNISMNHYINLTNQSVVNWANSTFTTLVGVVEMVGNWSADRVNYYNKTEVYNITEINAINVSINNTINTNNQSVVNWATATFTTLVGIVNQVGNWSADKVNYYNKTEVYNNTEVYNISEVNDINTSMKNYVDVQNGSLVNYINATNTSMKNYVDSVGNRWDTNYTNMQTNCGSDFVTGMFSNGTFMCGTVQQASEEDPYWTANYTAFNATWSNTTNMSYVPYTGANQNVVLGNNNLSVDTNTLLVDSNNSRVGIGTSAPSKTLEVNGTFKANASQGSITLDENGNVLIGI